MKKINEEFLHKGKQKTEMHLLWKLFQITRKRNTIAKADYIGEHQSFPLFMREGNPFPRLLYTIGLGDAFYLMCIINHIHSFFYIILRLHTLRRQPNRAQ